MKSFHFELKPINGGEFFGYIVKDEVGVIHSEGTFDFQKEGWILMNQTRATEVAHIILNELEQKYNQA